MEVPPPIRCCRLSVPKQHLLQLRTAYALPRRQPQPHQQPAQILALFQCDIAAVNLRDVAYDREAKPRPRLAAVEPHPAVEDACPVGRRDAGTVILRSEEHTSELLSLMRISYAVFCLNKKKNTHPEH